MKRNCIWTSLSSWPLLAQIIIVSYFVKCQNFGNTNNISLQLKTIDDCLLSMRVPRIHHLTKQEAISKRLRVCRFKYVFSRFADVPQNDHPVSFSVLMSSIYAKAHYTYLKFPDKNPSDNTHLSATNYSGSTCYAFNFWFIRPRLSVSISVYTNSSVSDLLQILTNKIKVRTIFFNPFVLDEVFEHTGQFFLKAFYFTSVVRKSWDFFV